MQKIVAGLKWLGCLWLKLVLCIPYFFFKPIIDIAFGEHPDEKDNADDPWKAKRAKVA